MAGIRVGLLLAMFSVITGCSKQPRPEAWKSSSAFVIEPGASIGPLRPGMTMKEVVAELGSPTKDREVLVYEDLGFHVLPARDGMAGGVICTANATGPAFKPFAGRTKEGVGLGSSRAEVVTAYGEPAEKEVSPSGAEVLKYKPLRMQFKIRNDRVSELAMFLEK